MDSSLFDAINRFAGRTSWAHGFMRFFASDGIVLFALLLLLAYSVSWRRRDLAGVAGSLWAGAAALVALGIGQIVGNMVDRSRPYESISHVLVLIDKTTDFSFPSDHATTVGAVAVGLYFVHRRIGIVAIAAAVFMAITRVYVGAHYPLDVVAGLALGGGVAAVGHAAITPSLAQLLERVAQSRARVLLVRPLPAGDS